MLVADSCVPAISVRRTHPPVWIKSYNVFASLAYLNL
jgi:hypothetical protein